MLVVTSHFSSSDRLGMAVGALFAVMAAAGVTAPLVVGAVSSNGGGGGGGDDDGGGDRVRVLGYAAFIAAGAVGTTLFSPPPPPPPPPLPPSSHHEAGEGEEAVELREQDAASEPNTRSGAQGRGRSKKKNCCLAFLTSVEWRLLLDPSFLILAVGSSLNLICMLNFYRLLPIVANAAQDSSSSSTSSSSSSSSAAGLLAIVNAVDLFARFFSAWLGDWKVDGATWETT